jgi:hypothetical protein
MTWKLHLGPYHGRSGNVLKVRFDGVLTNQHVSGIMLNPNTQFMANFVPILSFSAFMKCPESYDADVQERRAAYVSHR